MKHLVEVICSQVIPVTAEAESEQEALDSVIRQQGEAGDTIYQEPSFEVKCLDDL